MHNVGLFRKIMIGLLGVATILVVVVVVMRSMDNRVSQPTEESTSEVEIKSAPELIAEKKFALVEINDEGFSVESYEVPLGGILEIRNNTDRVINLDIRKEDFITGVILESADIFLTPVFIHAGEYTMSEYVDGEFSEMVRATVIVK